MAINLLPKSTAAGQSASSVTVSGANWVTLILDGDPAPGDLVEVMIRKADGNYRSFTTLSQSLPGVNLIADGEYAVKKGITSAALGVDYVGGV